MQRNPALESALSVGAHLRTLFGRRVWGRRQFRFTVDGHDISAARGQYGQLAPDSIRQLQEVLQRLVQEPVDGRWRLSLEAITRRYIPSASLVANLEMFDSDRFWRRESELSRAREKAKAALAPPGPGLSPSEEAAEVKIDDSLLKAIEQSERVSWIIGAGISVAAGIPTYRGRGGLYRDKEMEKLVTLPNYLANPDLVWAFINEKKRVIGKARPTRAHEVMALFNGLSKQNIAITQNVDGLERVAGVETINLHGRLFEYKCLKEEKFLDAPDPRYNDEDFPVCPDCGGLLKPGVVFFFEGLPADRFDRALDVLADSELVFEVGTSHTVYPVAHLWRFAKNKGARVVVINKQRPEGLSQEVDFLQGDCQVILDAILKRLKAP